MRLCGEQNTGILHTLLHTRMQNSMQLQALQVIECFMLSHHLSTLNVEFNAVQLSVINE